MSSQWLWGLAVWLPVACGVAVIARESTSAFGSAQTSAILRHLWEGLFGAVSDARWPEIHHHIRKTGHFLGYGTLGLLWLRAWMHTWLGTLRLKTAAVWRMYSVAMAVSCTAFIASMDELHQSFLPDRTGVPEDVLLDTAGAIALMMLVSLFWLRSPDRS